MGAGGGHRRNNKTWIGIRYFRRNGSRVGLVFPAGSYDPLPPRERTRKLRLVVVRFVRRTRGHEATKVRDQRRRGRRLVRGRPAMELADPVDHPVEGQERDPGGRGVARGGTDERLPGEVVRPAPRVEPGERGVDPRHLLALEDPRPRPGVRGGRQPGRCGAPRRTRRRGRTGAAAASGGPRASARPRAPRRWAGSRRRPAAAAPRRRPARPAAGRGVQSRASSAPSTKTAIGGGPRRTTATWTSAGLGSWTWNTTSPAVVASRQPDTHPTASAATIAGPSRPTGTTTLTGRNGGTTAWPSTAFAIHARFMLGSRQSA